MSSVQTAPGPGVVLVGLPPESEATAQSYAARGYAVATAGVDETTSVERGLELLRAAMDALAARPDCNGKVAVAGYAYGGRFAFLAVTRLGADAAAAFHGIGIGEHLSEAPRVKKPLSFHFADDDEFVPFAEVRAIKGALEGFGTTAIYRYPNREDLARQAEARAFTVLDELR